MSLFGDRVIKLRTETVHKVMPAKSVKNVFGGITLPHNPGLADINFNSGHQDSYCSESVGLTGPNSDKLRLIVRYNPYGMSPVITCNRNNQMIALSLGGGIFRIIVFDTDCEILSATRFGYTTNLQSFKGGYFFLNKDDNAIAVGSTTLTCLPTANVEKRDKVYSLTPIWTSDDLVQLITKVPSDKSDNSVYIAMPVWQTVNPHLYWVLLAGKYDFDKSVLVAPAYVAVVEIKPDPTQKNGCHTRVMDSKELKDQWNNNTIAASPQGVFFVTNGCDATGACTTGYLHSIGFNTSTNKMKTNWSSTYKNSGVFKSGQKNIGSGTTPTLFDGPRGEEYVGITDNAYPQVNVVVYQRSDGKLISEAPVFPKMRGCDEASLIAVNGRIIVENNFGHTVDYPNSQYIANEPGMDLIQVNEAAQGGSDHIWHNEHFSVFGMSMLARESGVIFANTGDWNVPDAATKGALYSVSAIDSWDGREIWRLPLGQGLDYCREYGGVYFSRNKSGSGTGTNLYIGTMNYLVSVQNYDESHIPVDDSQQAPAK